MVDKLSGLPSADIEAVALCLAIVVQTKVIPDPELNIFME
jgi:hypothetical protein